MPISPRILEEAKQHGYAIGAFNTNNLECTQAIFSAAAKERSPIIIQVTEGACSYATIETWVAMVRAVAQAYQEVPYVLHLDHGKHVHTCIQAMRVGFDSVMFDGSHLPLEENIRYTKEVVEEARQYEVLVEAEVGTIGGTEDLVSTSSIALTNPEDAVRFVHETQCNSLAIGIGTVHGANKHSGNIEIDFQRLEKIRQKLPDIPLVLHGASTEPHDVLELAKEQGVQLDHARGIPYQMIQRAIAHHIAKVNTDTDIRIAFITGIRKVINDHPEVIDPRKYLGEGRKMVEGMIRRQLQILGSSNRY